MKIMKKIRPKLKYIIIPVLFLCLCAISSSYSYYKLTKENKNALTLNGVELDYTITSDSLENKTIQVPAGSKQTITFDVTSNNEKDAEYEVYYQIIEALSQEEKEKISVTCYENISESLPTGEITPDGVKTIIVEIENNSTSPVTIELGCQGGLIGRDLVLEQGNKIPVVSIPILQSEDSNEAFWQYKSSITKVIFQNQKQSISNAAYQHDISEANDGSIMAYLVLNSDQSTYTAYIQSDGVMQANSDCYEWFADFSNLQSIEGLEYFDTSQVTSMWMMFFNCRGLTNLDLRNFDTSKVTVTSSMFGWCTNLTSLDISNFNTSQVDNMASMFEGCQSLTSLDLSHFDTS